MWFLVSLELETWFPSRSTRLTFNQGVAALSDNDERVHYTAYELDKAGNAIDESHIADEKVWTYFRAEHGRQVMD